MTLSLLMPMKARALFQLRGQYFNTSQNKYSTNKLLFFVRVLLVHCTLKNLNNYLNTNIYSYLQTPGGQSSSLYLNVVHFENTGVKQTSVIAQTALFHGEKSEIRRSGNKENFGKNESLPVASEPPWQTGCFVDEQNALSKIQTEIF